MSHDELQGVLQRMDVRVAELEINAYRLPAANVQSAVTRQRVLHFSHGFGANGLTFENVMTHLSSYPDIKLTCTHDTAGFGQSNFAPPEQASAAEAHLALSYNGQRVSTAVLEHACAADGVPAESQDVVFCGHSMGCISAIFSAVEWRLRRGHRVAAVVLICPAISAGQCQPGQEDHFDLATAASLRGLFAIMTCLRALGSVGAAILRAILLVVLSVPRFWNWGLWYAHAYATGLPTPRLVAQYASAASRHGWRRGLVAFLDANVWSKAGRLVPPLDTSLPEMLEQLHEAGTKVLIVHHERDTFVPVEQSRRLVAALPPGVATLEIMRGTGGHMPHEADTENFCALLQKHGVVGATG